MTHAEPFKALRIPSGYDSLLSSSRPDFQFEAVSMSDESMVPSSLDGLCNVIASDQSLEWFLCTSLLPNDAGFKAVQDCAFKEIFYDPELLKAKDYCRFISQLYRGRLIDFSPQSSCQEVGVLFVAN